MSEIKSDSGVNVIGLGWAKLAKMAAEVSEHFRSEYSQTPAVLYLGNQDLMDKLERSVHASEQGLSMVNELIQFPNGFKIEYSPGLGNIGVLAPEDLSYRGYSPSWLREPVIQVPPDFGRRIDYIDFGLASNQFWNGRGSGKTRAVDYSRKNKLPRKRKKAFIKTFGREAYHMGFFY